MITSRAFVNLDCENERILEWILQRIHHYNVRSVIVDTDWEVEFLRGTRNEYDLNFGVLLKVDSLRPDIYLTTVNPEILKGTDFSEYDVAEYFGPNGKKKGA